MDQKPLSSSFKFLRVPASTFFPIYEKNKPWWKQILDPESEFVTRWNHIFLVMCFVAVFIDPLYLYLPKEGDHCLGMDNSLGVVIIVMRSIVDLFAALHIFMKFRTAYVAPNSRVLGKGDLVLDSRLIARRYLRKDFWFDVAAALPLPQIFFWFVFPSGKSPTAAHANHAISLIIILQYIPRWFVIFPLYQKIIKTTGLVVKTAWAGAAYNITMFLLLSHIIGAVWYVLANERQHSCWKNECRQEADGTRSRLCNLVYLDCDYVSDTGRKIWFQKTKVFENCDAKMSPIGFQYGIFSDCFLDRVSSANFFDKYFYCLWWGLKNLSAYGQSLMTTTSILETTYSSLICILGLVFVALLIGNMQTYLQSTTARLEEWRIRRRDTEEWMRHRQLPPGLQERVRRFVHYKWLATRGVDEEEILKALPLDLRRQIQRHLCLGLVRRVTFFSQMDDQLLDAICERLVSSLTTKDTYIVREGDPVNEMIFIIRGQLESSTTNGGQLGFFNSITLEAGDFCGEELLTWALIPYPNASLPSSTRTVKALSEVEAFALRAEALKFVSQQFKHLHSKKLQHAFRYYSNQWRTWGSCFIQAAWRRYKRRKLAEELAKQEGLDYVEIPLDDDDNDEYNEDSGSYASGSTMASNAPLRTTILASRFAANTRRGGAGVKKVTVVEPSAASLKMPKLFKPDEPDFSAADREHK